MEQILPQNLQKRNQPTGDWWLMPVILATQEAEIRRIKFQGHLGEIVCETPSLR
jgi:hypothetical protein